MLVVLLLLLLLISAFTNLFLVLYSLDLTMIRHSLQIIQNRLREAVNEKRGTQ